MTWKKDESNHEKWYRCFCLCIIILFSQRSRYAVRHFCMSYFSCWVGESRVGREDSKIYSFTDFWGLGLARVSSIPGSLGTHHAAQAAFELMIMLLTQLPKGGDHRHESPLPASIHSLIHSINIWFGDFCCFVMLCCVVFCFLKNSYQSQSVTQRKPETLGSIPRLILVGLSDIISFLHFLKVRVSM